MSELVKIGQLNPRSRNVNLIAKVTNGFIKLFKGKMQLNLGRYGSVEEVDEVIEEVNLDNNLSETPQPQMRFGERRPPRRFRRR